MFKKAVKHESKLRMALVGPSSTGKTYTALSIASALGGKVAVIDTERGSASKYSDLFDFDVLELESFAPERYIEGISDAKGYSVLVIDSLSHAWSGKDGLLEFVDKEAARMKGGNSFGAWRNATPKHNQFVDAILGAKLHVLVTMRAKTEYVQEKDERGKTQIRKVGLAPIQRDGLEYEFDVVGDLDQDNNLIITKSRCPQLAGGIFNRAGADVAGHLQTWLGGAPVTLAEPVAVKLETISKAAATRLATKIKDLGLEYPNEAAFIEAALGLGTLEAFAELSAEQAKKVWEHATSAAAKEVNKQPWERWEQDSDATAYAAAMGREHGIFPDGGGQMMGLWEETKSKVRNHENLYAHWYEQIGELVATKRQAA